MKKFISLFLAAVMMISSSIIAFAAEDSETYSDEKVRVITGDVVKPSKADVEAEYVLAGYSPENCDFMTGDYDMVTASSVRSVPVTEPCDKSWRDKYPDTWMWEANRTVQAADDLLESRYSIRFYSVAQKYWDSSNVSTDSWALIRDAHLDWGLTNGAKLMIAFTDRDVYADGSKIYGRVENIGMPYVLVSCYGFNENRMTVRHEVGHAYGLYHCSYGTNCFMSEAAPASTYNSVCSSHNSQWHSARTKY